MSRAVIAVVTPTFNEARGVTIPQGGRGAAPRRGFARAAGEWILMADGAMWVYLLSALFAVSIAYDLLHMPIQVHDSLGELLDAMATSSPWRAFIDASATEAYFRPLRMAQIKLLFDLSGGHYWLAFRGWHAFLLCATFVCFTRALRVRARADVGPAAFALVVLMGTHTFPGLVREAFPINHFLEVALACLVVLNLAQSRGGWAVDLASMLTFAAAALTLESGLLVWVVVLVAWAVGLRGISWRGVVAITVLMCGYFTVRFLVLDVGTPMISERSSGFLFRVLDPPELERTFGQAPAAFYAYNVVTSALSVFFAEPQHGVFSGLAEWMAGEVSPRVLLGMMSAIPTTALMCWALFRSRVAARAPQHAHQLLAIGLCVVGANAALSFAYTKDEIMSVAGVFYALMAFAAVRMAREHIDEASTAFAAWVSVVLVVAGIGWAVRSAGVHYLLNLQAARHRYDWAVLPVSSDPVGGEHVDAESAALVRRLRDDALRMPLPGPRYYTRRVEDLWGD